MKKGSTAAAHARKSHMCLWRENLSGHEAEKKVHTHARLVCCTRARAAFLRVKEAGTRTMRDGFYTYWTRAGEPFQRSFLTLLGDL